jgi:hypothetical protein
MHKKLPMLCAQFDFSGVTPWNPLASPAPEPGPYEGTIIDIDPAYNGGKSCKFTVDLSSGQQTDIYIGNEPGEKGGNKKKWLQALCAVAPDVDKFLGVIKTNPTLSFDPVATFKGKKIHVLVIEVPGQDDQGRKNLPNKEFLTKAQFDQVKASGVVPHASAPKSNGATAATPAAATPAPSGDVLKGLFG